MHASVRLCSFTCLLRPTNHSLLSKSWQTSYLLLPERNTVNAVLEVSETLQLLTDMSNKSTGTQFAGSTARPDQQNGSLIAWAVVPKLALSFLVSAVH